MAPWIFGLCNAHYRNAEFIDQMIADPVFADMLSEPTDQGHGHGHSHGDHGHDHGHGHSHSHGSHAHSSHGPSADKTDKAKAQADNDLSQDKIRSTLRSLVRDWAEDGAAEREACYSPCLAALERYFPKSQDRPRASRKVLVPGCGLGRLAMEIAALGELSYDRHPERGQSLTTGFSSQGNEFSTYMLITSHFMLNQTSAANAHEIFPYLHSFSNHTSTEHSLLRKALIPDVVPADVLAGQDGEFSLVAGDFEEIYGGASLDGEEGQRGQWSAVVTCFFIDCVSAMVASMHPRLWQARNVLTFLKIIHALLEPGGVWINIGPLLWHFENSPTKSAKGEGSIELSLDEVKELARAVGFDIHVSERSVSGELTTGRKRGPHHIYGCASQHASTRILSE